jgi:hypothetical protein
MTNGITEEQFEDVLGKSIKEELRKLGWPVYWDYEIVEEGGEVFVVASVTTKSFAEEEPSEETVEEGIRIRKWKGRSPTDDAFQVYAPLGTPELVIDLAELDDEGITPEAVRSWAEIYGLLGLPGDDEVKTSDESMKFRVKRWGRRDNVARFAEAAGEIRACLRAYEEATAGEGPLDLEAFGERVGPIPKNYSMQKARRPWDLRPGEERRWLLRFVGRITQTRLAEHCYPMLSHYPDGRFALAYGFKNLLGACWLQMAWLLSGDSAKRCKLRDCFRVISFEPGEQPPIDAPKGKRGKYKTREDKEFCSHNHAAKYSYRKKKGWPGYV